MCGIAAEACWKRPADPRAVARAVDALSPRGPDGRGLWEAPSGRAALGHARLAIVDLEGGAQPLFSEDGRVAAVVNGELYDAERLRAGLEARGHRFKTRSDSELVIHLYEEHGEGLARFLRGEYAFILWDEGRRTLLAARDPFGIKPLHYALRDGALLLASEAKALFAAGVPASWDLESLHHALSLQYPLPGRTYFAGVRQLLPGHLLKATPRDWSQTPISGYEGVERGLPAALEEAVALRLRADVPVACSLSGGVDSSAVFALACRAAGRPIPAFTVSFEEGPYDELALAEETARWAGAELHPVRLGPGALADALGDAVRHAEGLAVNAHLSAKFLLSRAIRAGGYKVVLTGEGADEILAGYPHFRRDWLADSGSEAAWPEAAHGVGVGIMVKGGPALALEAARGLSRGTPSFLEAKASLGFRVREVLDPEFKKAFSGRDPVADLLEAVPLERSHSRLRQAQALWAKTGLAQSILKTLGDGTESAHGIEGRLPFLDPAVVRAAAAVPPESLWRGGLEKAPLREAVRGLIPESVRLRPKHPFYAPPVSGKLEELLRETLPRARGIFNGPEVLSLLDARNSERERAAVDPVLMLALTTALLAERYGL